MRRILWQRVILIFIFFVVGCGVIQQFVSRRTNHASPQVPDSVSGKTNRQIFHDIQSLTDSQKSPSNTANDQNDSRVEVKDKEVPKVGKKTKKTSTKSAPKSHTASVTPSESSSTTTAGISGQINAHIQCVNKNLSASVEQRSGNYWVFYNYIRAERTFLCNETITYTTHGEYTFLHNLEPLLNRWQGPISLAIFTPGDDYLPALNAIMYYRECSNSTIIKDFVTFHFYFPYDHMPNTTLLNQENLKKFKTDCSVKPAVIEDKVNTYRNSSGLDYPVNVGRNIARTSANSHFVFPSDIELYPNPGLIPSFFDVIRRNEKFLKSKKPRVFVSSIFEIQENAILPNTKLELLDMLKKNIVIPFHKKVCSQCHAIPKSKEWTKAPVRENLNVFHVAKRTPPYSHWEPIYIGTNDDPLYDERLSWEGRSDKMTQGYQLCVLDYEFMILDNAFLIHRPGIKTKTDNLSQTQKNKVAAQNTLISKTIIPELKKLYGTRRGCEK